MGDAVVIYFGGNPAMEHLGCQGPPEPCNESAESCRERNEEKPSHEIAFLRISAHFFSGAFDGEILHREGVFVCIVAQAGVPAPVAVVLIGEIAPQKAPAALQAPEARLQDGAQHEG